MRDNTARSLVTSKKEEEKEKKKKRELDGERKPVCEVEIYLRPCTSRASDSCLQSRPAGWVEKEERENASVEEQGGKLQGEKGGGGCETRKRMQKRGKYPTHPLAPPARPPEPASPRPNYRAHRSHHLVHARNLHPTSISFVAVELNPSSQIVRGKAEVPATR